MGPIDDLVQRLRAEAPVLGQLPARMRFKQALVARVGVEAAFALARPHLGVPGLDRLNRRPVLGTAEAARHGGGAFHRLWEGGQTRTLPMPRVVGAGDAYPVQVTDRAAWLARLDGVMLRGRSEILLHGGAALVDAERDERTRVDDQPEYDPALLASEPGAYWMMEPAGPVPELPEALSLVGAHAVDFGHWLVELLPKLAAARAAGWDGGMPVLVDQNIPGTVRQALPDLLGAAAPLRVVPHLAPLQVDRLWCAAHPTYPGFYPGESPPASDADRMMAAPWRLAELLHGVAAAFAPLTAQPTGHARVLLARRTHRKKSLLNEDEVLAVARRRGFHVAYPEDLPLREQLRLVRHATHLLAPEGSGGLLSLLGSAGAGVCLLSNPRTQRLTDIVATLTERGLAPVVFTGPEALDAPGHDPHPYWGFWNDYRIDAAALDDFLAGWLGQASSDRCSCTS